MSIQSVLKCLNESTKRLKLFHGTSAENAKSILETGFILSDSDSATHERTGYKGKGLYGFISPEDASNFALNKGYEEYAVIAFTIPLDVCIEDSEYVVGAYVVTDVSGIKDMKASWTLKQANHRD